MTRVPMMNIVLFEPEIPHNTGAIGRLCVGLDAALHIIQPAGFRMTDTAIRRAGLDYWQHLDIHTHRNWETFLSDTAPRELVLTSTRGNTELFEFKFTPGIFIVLGSESRGLPAGMITQYRDRIIRIPMPGAHARSINMANAAAIVMYEAYRQITMKHPSP